MKKIQLTRDRVTLVDDEDFEELNQWKWHAWKPQNGSFYARRSLLCGKVLMHRQILGLKCGDLREGDHRNHNTLDNTRSNLRICTHKQNLMNQKPQRWGVSSRFKGVYWCKEKKKMGSTDTHKRKKEVFRSFQNRRTCRISL